MTPQMPECWSERATDGRQAGELRDEGREWWAREKKKFGRE